MDTWIGKIAASLFLILSNHVSGLNPAASDKSLFSYVENYHRSVNGSDTKSLVGFDVYDEVVHPDGYSKFILPVHRANYRTRRLNGELTGIEEVPLVPGYGTHIAFVYVGTPPQRVSVIVDTGSHFTAFPCKGCDSCGIHTDPYWDFDASNTSTITTCADCNGIFACSKPDNYCVFGQSYSEGSSWKAFQVTDRLYTGLTSLADTPEEDKNFGLDFMFGCISKQTGLFNSQLADGIMGMSASEYTIVAQLYKLDVLREESFSICFSEKGGTMVLGGSENMLWKSEMEFTPNIALSGWFTVELVDILIGETSIGVESSIFQRGKGVIVDSGTTDTYLPTTMAAEFRETWRMVTGIPYSNSDVHLSAEQLKLLPTIYFVLGNNVKVGVSPGAYLSPRDEKGTIFSPNIYLDELSGAVLGANFMRDHDVLFDHQNKRVGFADANCGWGDLQEAKKNQPSPSPTPIPTPIPSPKSTNAPTLAYPKTLPEAPPEAPLSTLTPTSMPPAVAPTVAPTLSLACNATTVFVMAESCNAKCPLGASSNSTVSGTELWTEKYQFEDEVRNSGCEILPKNEERPCTLECTVELTNPSPEKDNCTTTWLNCDVFCEQIRYVRDASSEDEMDCKIEKRNCHIGSDCPESNQGLLVTGGLRVYFKAKQSWTSNMSDCIADSISNLVILSDGSKVQPGNVEIYPVIELQESRHRALQSLIFYVPFAIHIYSSIDELSAFQIDNQLLADGFSNSLQNMILSDSENRFQDSLPEISVESQDVSILNAYDKSVYRFSNDNAVGSIESLAGSDDDFGTNFAIFMFVMMILMIVIMIVTCRKRDNRRLNPAPTRVRSSNKYRVVGKGDDLNDDEEFEMTETGPNRQYDADSGRAPVL